MSDAPISNNITYTWVLLTSSTPERVHAGCHKHDDQCGAERPEEVFERVGVHERERTHQHDSRNTIAELPNCNRTI